MFRLDFKDYEKLTNELFSAAATVGMKTTCLDLELEPDSATSCVVVVFACLVVSNFKLCFCQNGTRLPGKFFTWCRT